jgi:transcriptional regulator with XRE-family HTH domain
MKSMEKWLREREQPVAPDELRAMREEAGLTPEKLVELVGVLPLEVTAWESGAISVERYQGEVMRWRVRTAQYEAGLPRSDCYWTRANEARLERMRQVGPYGIRQAERERVEHEGECTECMRVQLALRDVPPPPDQPRKAGFLGRRPGKLDLGVLCGVVYLAYKGLRWVGGSRFDPSLMEFASLIAAGAWFFFLSKLLQPLEDRHPYLAGHLVAAGITLPATIAFGVLGHADLSGAGGWVTAGLFSAFVGSVLGYSSEQERDELLRLDDPLSADEEHPLPADEERVVVIPQQGSYWNP